MESETDYRVEANRPGRAKRPKRRSSILIVATLVAVVLSSVGLYLFARDPYSENEIRHLIEQAYNRQRPGGGRLYRAAYFPAAGILRPLSDLGKAQLLLLRYPESETRQRLQGLLYLASGNWQKYVEAAAHFSPEMRRDPAVLNNLGASYLALSQRDPSNLLKALDQLEGASHLNPKAPEPAFNLVITYRQLRLHRLGDEALERYASLDAGSPWSRDLTHDNTPDKSELLDELKTAVESKNQPEAERVFDKNPDLFRLYAREYESSETEELPAALHFIASEMDRRSGDKTVSAMLAPLFSNKRNSTVALRQFVTEGAELFVQGNLAGSLEAYAKAEELLRKTDSLFDRLWIDVNRADTEIRDGQFESARESLERVVSLSRKNGFIWLEAKALSIYGSTLRLTSSYGEMMKLLVEADRRFTDVSAPHDRVRVLYYLAIYQYGAGDQDEALRLALECLRLADDNDSLRLSTLDWLIGSILYRQQMADRAILFEQESLEQSQRGRNPGMETVTASTLAQLHESMTHPKLAEEYLKTAEDALKKMPPGFDHARDELLWGTIKARIDLNRKQWAKAESLLEKNLEIYSRQPFPATYLLSQSLMSLAQAYSQTGQTEKAAQKFNQAIAVVENDDHYLESEKLRIKFDDERRDLYDAAIEFEYKNGSIDAAWTYLQKYRAKLFIEFLAEFDANVGQAHAQALDRSSVQKLIPADTQIIEYALLKDQLLIWLISKDLFTLRSVPVARSDVEAKVRDVLRRLRNRDDVDLLLTDLGNTLIGPVGRLLDPNRTVVIIPDGALHGLPFEALRRPGTGEYLIQEFPVMISPNLTHLLLTTAVQPRRDGIIGFGSQNGDSSELKELAALAGIYPKSQMFGGRQVDKANFLAAMTKAAVFHYAGHSATDAVDPLRSSILLDGNRFGPNSVTAVDIAQQRLANNAVVILSSCDSSVGNSRDGVGVRGLTSAFLIGGAGSVVGSLWPVEASSTANLMIRFHRALVNSQMPEAKALRNAQLTFLQSFPDRAHPYYWSGFVVTGNFTALR